MTKTAKIASVGKECVACGCCVSVCPMQALHIDLGVFARVDDALCVGCGKCAAVCPAAVITVVTREEAV